MQQPDPSNPSTFQVVRGEVITIVAEPDGVASENVSAAKAGQVLPNLNTDPNGDPRFSFTIGNGLARSVRVRVMCNFPDAGNGDIEIAEPSCTFLLQGSAGGSVFTGPVIKKSDSFHALRILFEVED